MIQQQAIEECTTRLLEAIGEDPRRDGLRDTPRRVAAMYRELFQGLGQDPLEVLVTGFEEEHQESVVLRDIPFYSTCEHHLLPFFGVAHLGYIPNGWVVGASKLVRALETLARRPQLQERLTRQLADTLFEGLKPDGVAVVISAEHLYMSMRGICKPSTKIVTSATRGSFQTGPFNGKEFPGLVHRE